ncbi:sulfurtransferase TusA family protein [Acinetobacter sp.]|uniref:sulfurtransferase TusA family protein n=1 Tax=Acinetobacter sp. TaxID=472 RepID=UPI00264A3D44|nr:sulfurtransferase TusA family protein [Acinetobacter sp.]MDN5511805.1 sulfurtransferase TusA family protein [Acinetobacter sp.]MDN5525694.1 sulfurtransferase TusA family protein [Acinetobacter sp.]
MNDLANSAIIIDAMGKPCPMPLLMLKRAIKNKSGGIFLLKSSDPHSQQDVSRYCQMHQMSCQMSKISDSEYHYLIES